MKTRPGKKTSLFYVLAGLVAASIIVILHISSTIQINKLAVTNNLLREEIKRKKEANDLLVTQVEKLSSYDRISNIAGSKFALRYKETAITDKKVVLKKSDMPK